MTPLEIEYLPTGTCTLTHALDLSPINFASYSRSGC